MSARLTISDLAPKYQAAAYAQLGAGKPIGQARANAVAAMPVALAKSRIRQNAKGLNKTEQAFADYLSARYASQHIHAQAVTLKLANGCRYTPDFLVTAENEAVHAYEVKGFLRDDAAVKIKVAARLFRFITFSLVTKGERGAWSIAEVLP